MVLEHPLCGPRASLSPWSRAPPPPWSQGAPPSVVSGAPAGRPPTAGGHVFCQVEGMVRDAINRNLLAFHDLLCSYDLGDTGLIGASSFKKVMHIFCPCLTAEHVAK